MHYYKRNIGDYHKKAGRLSMLQHGAYTLLMDSIYDREEFPTRDDAIDWVWASSADEIEAVEFVLSKFFDLDGDVYVQNRMSQEIQEYTGVCRSNSINGKKGGRPKGSKNKPKESEPVNKKTHSVNLESELNPIESELKPNHKPLTTNQEPKKNRGTRLSIDILPDEWGHFCSSERNDLNPQNVFDEFRDYWISVAGSKGVKLDWFATWRNWVRKQRGSGGQNERQQTGSTSRAKQHSDKLDEIARASIERERAASGSLDGGDIQEDAGSLWP